MSKYNRIANRQLKLLEKIDSIEKEKTLKNYRYKLKCGHNNAVGIKDISYCSQCGKETKQEELIKVNILK